jgi:hypothetical protein
MTGTIPLLIISRCSAAARERSIIRPATNGPLSFTSTVTCRLLSLLVTRTKVLKGRLLWAAVNRVELNISPEAVGRPSNSSPYQDAYPSSRYPAETWDDWASTYGANRMALYRANTTMLFRLIITLSAFLALKFKTSACNLIYTNV